MFPVSIERIVEERRKDLLREAEHMRLLNSLQRQRPNEPKRVRKAANWLGVKLVEWGLKLQNCYNPESPSQARLVRAVDGECP